MEGIVTPFIGYAVFEGDVVNVSHLELQFSFDVTTENTTMWPGGECIESKKIGKWSLPPSHVNMII